jgi:hypothetical protein
MIISLCVPFSVLPTERPTDRPLTVVGVISEGVVVSTPLASPRQPLVAPHLLYALNHPDRIRKS